MCGRLDSYLISFSHLTCNKDRQKWPATCLYRSPYLPLLLLTIVDQIHHGEILRNFISPTSTCEERYSTYFDILVIPKTSESFSQAFLSLSTPPFSQLISNPEMSEMEKSSTISTTRDLRKNYLGARFSEDLYTLLQMNHLRTKIRNVLVKNYFAEDVWRVLQILTKP